MSFLRSLMSGALTLGVVFVVFFLLDLAGFNPNLQGSAESGSNGLYLFGLLPETMFTQQFAPFDHLISNAILFWMIVLFVLTLIIELFSFLVRQASPRRSRG
ncbi:hypothetical protein ACE1TH_15440 [Shouchella sp. JSM 1781072]|uniref:hypothetical protein n=1 Tax=Bacillaceae TaxID=186817 RepID=UPI000C08B636|nr:hypothetical protein [Bacillus sp. Marseille-P3800]